VYSSTNFILVIKSRRMRWAGHVPRMETGKAHVGIWMWTPDTKRPHG
jgi:hypothetical protein